MGSMRNGGGDDLFALFTMDGCFLKGFAHTAPMTPDARRNRRVWKGVLASVPTAFNSGLTKPAFMIDHTTFCIWQRGKIRFPKTTFDYKSNLIDPDGSEYLSSPFDGKPEPYFVWARDYFDLGNTGTAKLVQEINPALTLAKLKGEIAEIGYPAR